MHLFNNGSKDAFQRAWDALQTQAIDDVRPAPAGWKPPEYAQTIAKECSVTGPATYSKGKSRTLRFLPAEPLESGWSFNRCDLPEQYPIKACLQNVARADRAIILRTGADANRLRMSEHIICHRLGLGIDNLRVEIASEDPPLFDEGSMPIVKALTEAGIVKQKLSAPLLYVTPKEPIVLMHPSNGGFLMWEPAENGDKRLSLDVAIDFPTAIGKERIQLDLCEETFIHGAVARTNCSASEMRMAKTIGLLFSEYRNLGYTNENILLADKDKYVNTPKLVLPSGKALEAVWHRTCLDLIAALSLITPGTRPAGKISSYKSGHVLDVRFLSLASLEDCLTFC
ncbi:MAG: UDP-3-O-acyl-N-acetylglucosamine deacetylase [Lentisphaeria bacterium]|nr:UDP-3-O-acyl-N-acetylglucosamine deacetylase [Lentisphaeria bacterium]